jgi:ribonuclease J
MRVCIRRGAGQIGGTCIEVESQGKRLVLDLGQPLDCPDTDLADMPDVQGFGVGDPSLLGVVLSHPHMDHYGLAFRVPYDTTFLMGEAAERILAAAPVFTPTGGTFKNVIHLVNGNPIDLGPFRITPFLMDHSAYDSYAILVEADGRRLFYTGDLRGHGRKSSLFERLVAYPPKDVDVLLMEGTTIGREGTEQGFPSEADLENDLVRIFRATPGMPLVWCSGQNIDRIVTIFRAALRSDRNLILDMYTAHMLDATGNPHLPQADWDRVSVFLPANQKAWICRGKRFDVSDKYKPYRIYPERLAAVAGQSVMLFRPAMRYDLEKAGCLDGACLVYSMWKGYMDDALAKGVREWLDQRGLPLHTCHTSGHAPLKDLRRLREAFAFAVVVPVHCPDPEAYAKAFANVVPHADNEWWDVDKAKVRSR